MQVAEQLRKHGKRVQEEKTTRVGKSAITALCAALLFCLSGCAVGPDFVRPEPPRIDHYAQGQDPTATVPANGQAQFFKQNAQIVGDWWRLFNSTGLDALVREAISNNQSLQAAQAALRQSRENLMAGYGVFFPQVDAGFDATRQKFSPSRFGGTSAASTFNLFTLSATVSYALDMFGGERRAVESLQAQTDFQRYAVIGTYLTLTGNIVNTIIARAAYSEEIKATEEIIGVLSEQTGITETQAQAGTVPYVNALSLRSQLSAFEATLPPLRQKLDQSTHLLATLAGRLPAEWSPPQIDLARLSLPADLPVSLPSQLVRQRPDILAAEAELHGASADIGVATAALFPSFTLSGGYGFNSTSMGDLLKSGSSIWNLGASVTAPLFHGGTLWHRRKAAIEAYGQSLAGYRQTVLSAFAQVADTLRALEHDAEALHAQSQALEAAAESLRLIRVNYQAGTVNYLQILIANYQYQQAKLGYLQAQAQRLQDTVALFVALGGGWWNAKEGLTDVKPTNKNTAGTNP